MSHKNKNAVRIILFYLLTFGIALIVVIPFFWMVSTSLKSKGAIMQIPIEWIPQNPTLNSYKTVFTRFPLVQAIINSFGITIAYTVITILSASMAAFAITKIKFPYADIIFKLFLASMMIPTQVTLIPLFVIMNKLGLINTYPSVILPSLFRAFAVFLLVQQMRGKPIETDAILSKPKAVSWKDTKIIFVDNTLSYDMKDNDIVYGLGQNVRGINKRGWVYISNCADDPIHTETKCSLYGAHNFLILDGSDKFGIFIDTPAPVTFDVGYTIKNQLKITVDNGNFECYMIKEDTLEKIVKAFRGLIGRSYIPPRWAFGYGQSRWGYESAEEIREVVKQHRQNKIPLDSIYLDIDYMEEYKDFTVNQNTFPDFQSFVNEMKEENIHLVPIIDAGIKVQDGYPIYEEGKSKGYFCKDEKGEDFIVGVWPGRCCFPDVLNEEAGRWFGNQYKVLLDAGIEGFWNDMNEPAIFYSEKRLKKVFEEIEEYKHQNLDVNSFFQFMDLVNHISSNQEDYESFYHEYKGKKYRHSELHNLFGYYMTRAAAEAFDAMIPGKRILLFSRASYIGMHRYGGVWQGDNCSWWSHLLLNIKMMPSLNMCGFLYTGADIGGFGENVTEDLLIRWLSFGVFTPLMRNHSARGTRTQEVYQFESTELFRTIIEVRYMLLPYLYSEFMKAALEDTMMFRPLGFCYGQDEVARSIEDQLLVGDSIMIAPVYEQNAIGRNVYFPERMKFLRFSKGNIIEEAVYEAGFSYIKMPLGDICVFIRENRILPISTGGEYTEQVDFENLECYSFGENVIPYQNYVDD